MRSGRPLGTDDTLGSGPGGIDRGQDLPPGTMVGEYQIEGPLGEGGMGRVFKAIHPVIAKQAAIKVLHPELSVNRSAVERFVTEARAVNQIGHPNIVDIFSFGTLPDGRCYFVMELLRGMSLRESMQQQPHSFFELLGLLETITIALEAAHEKGIIHRDLKPDNIFLHEVRGEGAKVKLLDFGIAKLLGTDDSRAQRTRTGNVLGTPAYISPEQARGHNVDHRTDIYALGALAFEMFTGQLPFPADSAADMIAKHLYQVPPTLRSLNPQVPPALDALVTSMLSKDAVHRPTLVQIRDQLRHLRSLITTQGFDALHGHVPTPGTATTILPEIARPISIAQTAETRPRRRGWIAGVIAGALVVATVIVVLVMQTTDRDPSPPAPSASTPTPPAPKIEPKAEPKIEPKVEPIVVPDPEAAASAHVDEPPAPAKTDKPGDPKKKPPVGKKQRPKQTSEDDDAPM
ncbi:MAG TPA: protein kinase [Kofleriaceae bacterium]|nr:protein kinase [Kofleriaceae bacterium]